MKFLQNQEQAEKFSPDVKRECYGARGSQGNSAGCPLATMAPDQGSSLEAAESKSYQAAHQVGEWPGATLGAGISCLFKASTGKNPRVWTLPVSAWGEKATHPRPNFHRQP